MQSDKGAGLVDRVHNNNKNDAQKRGDKQQAKHRTVVGESKSPKITSIKENSSVRGIRNKYRW